jgi:hypothetical protein
MAFVGPGSGDTGGFYLSHFDQVNNKIIWSAYIGTYLGLTWMKNVWVITRDFWDKSLSTPYSGQLYPTGGNNPGPGQVYPY